MLFGDDVLKPLADLAKAALHQAEAPGINNTTHNSEDIHG